MICCRWLLVLVHPENLISSAALALLLCFTLSETAHGGGPRYVAGVSFFDRTAKGTPLLWQTGAISYYTDQGNLSDALPAAAADEFVADAFSRWTSIATAAVSANQAGKLDEDVSGANLFVNPDHSITAPSDIVSTATDKPVAIVYDADGTVTDALMGTGAGGASSCFNNAVFGGPDNFSPDAHLSHALVVINGNCATSQQLADVKYRLVRVLGRVLGLDWSQANLDPAPQDDAGFPVMHAYDPVSCVPISSCYANADQPKMDDRAALSRLYPVTQANLSAFQNKKLFQINTVRIHGSVYFLDANGQPAQPMQGVNVVARLIDSNTLQASRTYVASSVSGFRFRGNVGNPVTGFVDPATGLRYDRFGSDDPALEGLYDLDGLEVPDPSGIADYQISVEPLDAAESQAVAPYVGGQVTPSGTAKPAEVFITLGNDIEQNILMTSSALQMPDSFGPQSFAAPAAVPGAGDWTGSLSGYGDVDYFQFSGLANRTLSVETTALDAGGRPTQTKAMPVLGLWTMDDTPGLPELASPEVFNGPLFGTTRLDAALAATTGYRLGIADSRGDGRPDYRYHARIFYGDQVTPPRASVAGGTPLLIQGLGFRTNTVVNIGGANAPLLAVGAGKLVVSAPALADGAQNVELSDPATGASSVMSAALTYGAGASDSIKILSTATNVNGAPLGGEVASPILVQVVGQGGVTPVAGASVALLAAPATLSACGGASTCTLVTDESGLISTRVTLPASASPSLLSSGITVTAQLAPASYSPPKQAQTTVRFTAAAPTDIVLSSPFAWIAQGATLDLPLVARVLAQGVPQAGQAVNYQVMQGKATLGAASANSDGGGFAGTTLHLSAFGAEVQVSACVGQSGTCAVFTAFPVTISALRLQPVAGSMQTVAAGQNFRPLQFRVVDSLNDPVQGADVEFQSVVTENGSGSPGVWIGDTNIDPGQPPVVLASYAIATQSGPDGIAVVQPPTSEIANVVISGTATTGVASSTFLLRVLPPLNTGTTTNGGSKLKVNTGAR